MTDVMISALPAMAAGVAALNDEIPVVDVSVTSGPTAGPGGEDKSVQVGVLAASFGQLAGDKINAQLYGIDPTGAVAIDTIVNALITGLGSQGGVIDLGAGTFKIGTGLVAHLAGSQTVRIRGAGTSATTLMYYGSGDCIRMYNSSAYGSGGAASYGSGVFDLTIDGTNATGSAVGLHQGDITKLQTDGVVIQNFTGTSSIGHHLDNTVTWTERGDHRATILNCTRGVVCEVTTGTASFGYNNFDYVFSQSGAQSCFTVLNGAFVYHCPSIRLRGNVNGSPTALSGNPAAIVVQGPGPVGSGASGANPAIVASQLDVRLEPNNLSGSATHFMATLYLDTAVAYGYTSGCYGLLDFSEGTGTFATINSAALPGSSNNFNFAGIVMGDGLLNASGLPVWQEWGSTVPLNALTQPAFEAYFPSSQADVFTTTLTASSTVYLANYAGGPSVTAAVPQQKLLFIHQPSSGGPYTLTWTMTGTATTANPVIVWAGGAPPVLQTVPGGTDVIALYTYDGATWYGQHLASYGTASAQAVTLTPRGQRVTLTAAFTSGTGTAAQNVTGLSAVLTPGTYKITGWFPMTPAGTTGSTQTLAFTFGGSSSGYARWLITGPATSATAAGLGINLASSASPAMTSTGLVGEFAGQVTVTASGTLQLTTKSGVSGDEVTFPVGAFVDIEPLA